MILKWPNKLKWNFANLPIHDLCNICNNIRRYSWSIYSSNKVSLKTIQCNKLQYEINVYCTFQELVLSFMFRFISTVLQMSGDGDHKMLIRNKEEFMPCCCEFVTAVVTVFFWCHTIISCCKSQSSSILPRWDSTNYVIT